MQLGFGLPHPDFSTAVTRKSHLAETFRGSENQLGGRACQVHIATLGNPNAGFICQVQLP